MKCQSFPCVAAVFALTLAWGLTSLHAADEAALDTATIEAITGLKGVSNQTEETFKVSKPRDDVSVTVERTHMAPFMGLTSWAAFMPSGKDSAMVMGDMVLFEDEVNPVMSAALNAGLQVTALHNHFFFDKPKVYFMHIGGEGSVPTLAQGVKAIFDTEKQIRTKAPAPLDSFGLGELSAKNAIDGSGISQVFGLKGDAKDGMYKVTIGRAVHTEAEFIFVPPDEVIEKAQKLDARPYDVHGVELTHDGEFCSFDAFLKKYNLDEPELRYLALIVRGADTDRHDLTPESGGLFAISLGLSDLHAGDDHAVLRDGFIVYDALYRWLKFCRGEKHLWFPPAPKPAAAS